MDRLPLQPKFAALLEGTASLFAGQDAHPDKDRNLVEHLRSQVLALTAEVAQPQFPAFLAYLLGTTAVDAHYPLQTIRMACLTAYSLRWAKSLPRSVIEECVVAAYFADVGFRAAWLGQKGSHAELSAYRLRDMRFTWMTPSLEKLILNHHSEENDLSPHKLVSLWSRYLAIVYGMGIDSSTVLPVSAVRGLEILIDEAVGNKDGVKILLKSLSAFPLGTWVELSNGQTALVVGNNPDHPLRPTVGFYRPDAGGEWRWEEHILQNEQSVHVTREVTPDAAQLRFLNEPKLWLAGWAGESTLVAKDFAAIFTKAQTAPVPPSKSESGSAVQRALSQSNATGKPVPLSNGSSRVSTEAAETELKRLRGDWERHVQMVEGSIQKLRDGLVDSYRRENEYFKEVFSRAGVAIPLNPSLDFSEPQAVGSEPGVPAANAGTSPGAPPALRAVEVAQPPAPDLASEIERRLLDIEALIRHQESTSYSEEQLCRLSLRDIRDGIQKRILSAPALKKADGTPTFYAILKEALVELDRAETNLINPVFRSVPELDGLKAQLAASQTFLAGVRRDKDARLEDWHKSWQDLIAPGLSGSRQRAETEFAERARRIEKIKELLKSYSEFSEGEGSVEI